jgi:hypothetical protein
MQNPVRFYITQSDDHAVVRSVPVAVRPDGDAVDLAAISRPQPDVDRAETAPSAAGRARVGRLVRAAARRTEPRR